MSPKSRKKLLMQSCTTLCSYAASDGKGMTNGGMGFKTPGFWVLDYQAARLWSTFLKIHFGLIPKIPLVYGYYYSDGSGILYFNH